MGLKIGQRSPLDCKAIKGVRDLDDPYSVPPNYLMRGRNLYLPDPGSGAGVRARPGFGLANADDPLGTVDSGRIGQAVVYATIEDGSRINFVCSGGKLYRVDPTFGIRVDVTPAAMPIDPGARVHMTPFSNRLCINDDLNPPWVASNLTATPVTGTVIVYSDPDVPWRAYGPGVVFDGSIVWLVRYRDTESRTARIAWSEPDDPLSGYFQTGPPAFDAEWDVIENSAETIYALNGENLALDYFRDTAIGYLSGSLGPDFRTDATKDAIDDAVGTRSPQTIRSFGNYTWFADSLGRVHRFKRGGGLEASWLQHRRVETLAPTGFMDATARSSCAEIVPELNLYVVALWSPDPTQNLPQFPTTLYAFHASTGQYVGEWVIGPGIAVHSMGVLIGAEGRKVLAVLGTKEAATSPQELGAGGYLWTLSSLADGIWTDNGEVPDILTRSGGLGYDPDIVLTVDEVVAVVQEVVTDPTPVEIDIVVA
jgi:hypothetical protein